MSAFRSRKMCSKKRKTKKEFLLTSKKCWLLDEKLIPLYKHLVDSYSVKLREEWNVKFEETDVEVVQLVKEEPQYVFFLNSQLQLNQLEVDISHLSMTKHAISRPLTLNECQTLNNW